MYIYEQPDWPNFKWDKDIINSKLIVVNKAVGFLMGRLSAIGFDSQMTAVVDAVAHDIIASCEIEGVELNNNQVRSSIARKLGIELPNSISSSRYIDGIVEMALDATINYSSPISDKRLFGWHNLLFPTGWSGSVKIDVASYRKGEMKVVSGMFGREKVHYITPPAESVAKEMSHFIEWFNTDSNPSYLKSAIAHLWFVCIHPFDDGNGRIGRAIADMALSQAENSKMRFFSISNQINKDKKRYYSILEKTQKGNCDITDWLTWYLECMLRSIKQAETILRQVLNKAIFWQNHASISLTERQTNIINLYLDGYQAKLTIKNWAKKAKVSQDTAARDIKSLVQKNILIPQQGKVRDAHYGIVCNESTVVIPMPQGED
ncbi:MAG: Fic family protein [Muribaculaceae bacterium]|nr:Fic family protein [Muribaculaceae bacterium]